MQNTNEKTIHDTLGQNTNYSFTYDKDLLVREPREPNRTGSNITNPGVGYDVWNGYELSFLFENGKPFYGYIKIMYSSENDYIVESKSLKLYLNSFNMSKFSIETGIEEVKETIIADLSEKLGTDVQVGIFTAKDEGKSYPNTLLPDYTYLESDTYSSLDEIKLYDVSVYNEDKKLLEICPTVIEDENSDDIIEFNVKSSLLRSNCKVTHQPDWGTVYIHYKGKKLITSKSLLKYIISFRGENHFHEEIVETIYDRLFEILEPEELIVVAKYTRRGGIDINPIRTNNLELIKDMRFVDINTPHSKTMFQ